MICIGIAIGIGPSGALLHTIGIGTIIGIGIGVGQWKCTITPKTLLICRKGYSGIRSRPLTHSLSLVHTYRQSLIFLTVEIGLNAVLSSCLHLILKSAP